MDNIIKNGKEQNILGCENKEHSNDDLLYKSIKKISKGSLQLFSTLIIAYILAFISRIILARYLGPYDFGTYNLGISIITIIGTLTTLSIPLAIAKYIPEYRTLNKVNRIRGIIFSSLKISFLLSISLTIFTIIVAPYISNIYNNKDLNIVIIILAIFIPFNSLITILGAIFQGFEQAKQVALFQNLLSNLIRIVFFIIIIQLSLNLYDMTLGYTASFIVVGIIFFIYFINKIKRFVEWKWEGTNEYHTLLVFSIPMFIGNIVWYFGGQLNIIIFGYYYPRSDIGIYSAVITLIGIPQFIIQAITFLYLPVYSSLLNLNEHKTMERTFEVMTKWMVFLSLPITSIFILFPSRILEFIFGNEYSSGGIALIYCTLGIFFMLLTSLSANSMIAMAKTRTCMILSIVSASIGILLGILLIPKYGMIGAAGALFIQYLIYMILFLGTFYFYTRFHPFTKAFIKPLISYVFLAIVSYQLILIFFSNISLIAIGIIFIYFFFLLFISILLTGGFEKTDVNLIILIEKRVNINLSYLRSIINKISKNN